MWREGGREGGGGGRGMWRSEVRGQRKVWCGTTRGCEAQLLSSNSVAVSTSQDFDDKATITAFWEINRTTTTTTTSQGGTINGNMIKIAIWLTAK